MILTEEEIGALFDYGFTTKAELVLARAIEQAILDKLQDNLKNAERYEWLRNTARIGHVVCPESTDAAMWVDAGIS